MSIQNSGIGYVYPGRYYHPAPFCFDDNVPPAVVLAASAAMQGMRMLAAELLESHEDWLKTQASLNPDYAGMSFTFYACIILARI